MSTSELERVSVPQDMEDVVASIGEAGRRVGRKTVKQKGLVSSRQTYLFLYAAAHQKFA